MVGRVKFGRRESTVGEGGGAIFTGGQRGG